MAIAAGILGICACHQEPPPPLYTGVGGPDPSATATEAVAPDAAPGARDLWFSQGPGLEAILARERRDHAGAIDQLDALLADEQLAPDERGGAQLLRGLEDLEADRFAAAADRFAEARRAPGLAAVDVWLRATEAQARLDAGQPELALSLVHDVQPTPPLAETLLVLEADALLRTDDVERARARYEDYSSRYPRGSRRHAVKLRLAELLVAAGEVSTAAGLLERVVLEVPLSQFGQDARRRLGELEKTGQYKVDAKHRHTFQRAHALAEIHARLDRRDYERAVRDVDTFLARKDVSAGERCEAMYAQATAVFKQRERSRAREFYERAAKQCQAAGSTDEVVKALYQAARGRYAQGQYAGAARDFEKLAADHAQHSYADDALIKAGESWEEGGEALKARHAYAKALEQPQRGDLADEARRRLLVQAFAEQRNEDALALVEKSLADGLGQRGERARLQYFRGRALAALGRPDEAQEAWLAAVSEMPLSYHAVQALSRLRDSSPDAFARGLNALEHDAGPPVSFELSATPAVERARVFARLGLGDQARGELDAAGVKGWPAVALLSQAGLYDAVQRQLAGMGVDWRATPPIGAHRRAWEIAHPTPFTEIIEPGEKEHGVPSLLTFAIMQTESRFNPGVTSWAGARGLVQLMPGTAKSVADRAGLKLTGDDALFDPRTNLGLGMRYLAQLSQRWGGGDAGPALAVPSYNAGAGSVDKWVAERGDWPLDLFIESIPFDETRNYTQKVLERWAIYRWMYAEGDDRLIYLPPQVPKRVD